MWKRIILLLPLCIAACGGGNNAPAPVNQPSVNQPAESPSAADKRRARELYDEATKKIQAYDISAAAELAEQAVELVPEKGEYHEQLGYAYEKLGRHEDARDSYSRAAELLDGESRGRCRTHVAYNAYLLGLADFNKAQYAAAVTHLRQSLDFNPAFRDAWMLLGNSQMNLKEYAAAAEAFGGAVGVSLSEQRFEPLSRQGQAQLYAEKPESAHATFSVLIDEGAVGYEAYGWRGYANLKLGRIDDAERDFQVAVQRTSSREKRAEYDAALKAIAESR